LKGDIKMELEMVTVSRTEKVMGWLKRNKKKIIIGVGAAAGLAIIGAFAVKRKDKDKDEEVSSETDQESENDSGRDLEMRFVDPETEEVLGKVECTESYMKDYEDYFIKEDKA
jgi:phosphopantothenoylcysteine synthetase/decarboxylase